MVARNVTQQRRPRRARRPRGSLSRDAVVDAALRVVDRDGFESLNMQRVAGELDCGVMSVYGYVRSKDELLALLSERVLRDFTFELAPDAAWGDALAAWARAFREHTLRFPSMAELLIARRLWSDRSPRYYEQLLDVLTHAGWPLREAVRAFHAVQNYALGFVLYEIHRTHTISHEEHVQMHRQSVAALPPDAYPLLHAAGDIVSEGPLPAQFAWGLERLLDGLAAELARLEAAR